MCWEPPITTVLAPAAVALISGDVHVLGAGEGDRGTAQRLDEGHAAARGHEVDGRGGGAVRGDGDRGVRAPRMSTVPPGWAASAAAAWIWQKGSACVPGPKSLQEFVAFTLT
jgi:hypothetical protein